MKNQEKNRFFDISHNDWKWYEKIEKKEKKANFDSPTPPPPYTYPLPSFDQDILIKKWLINYYIVNSNASLEFQ